MKKLLSALAISILAAAPAPAAVVDFEFTVDIGSGTLVGETFAGSFSYEGNDVGGVGDEFVDLLSFEFDYQGIGFGVDDAIAEAVFFDGEFLGLSYIVGFPAPVSFSFIPGFFSVDEAFFAYEDPFGDGDGSIAYAQVSEPSALWLLVIGLAALSLGLAARRRRPELRT